MEVQSRTREPNYGSFPYVPTPIVSPPQHLMKQGEHAALSRQPCFRYGHVAAFGKATTLICRVGVVWAGKGGLEVATASGLDRREAPWFDCWTIMT